jgi:hypothetical protein
MRFSVIDTPDCHVELRRGEGVSEMEEEMWGDVRSVSSWRPVGVGPR